MAIDEALLDAIDGPVLRVYRWARPAVSFGYFERWKPVQAAHPDREAVRRWTGGGVVLHGDDFTYSLLLPPGGVPIMEGAAGSYKIIHHALCQALQDIKINAEPAPTSAEKLSQACFENPVRYDVLVDGRKVAGAAQRRSRKGLIHQGSIQALDLPAAFGPSFAGRLGAAVEVKTFDVIKAAEKLAAEKYGTAGWLEKRP